MPQRYTISGDEIINKSMFNLYPCGQWDDKMDIKFIMAMDEELARKMSYIGKYYGSSRTKEIK